MPRFAAFSLPLLLAVPAFAQAGDARDVFEAASIKPFPEGSLIQMSGCMGGPGTEDPGSIHCEYVTVKNLLMRAYGVRNQEIAGPAWMDSAHFNILAKVPHGATKEQTAAMFRNLLEDRFKVALHHESRLLAAYALTIAKGGPKLQEYDPSAPVPGDPPPGSKLATGDDGFPVLRRSVIASGPITLFRNGRARLQGGNIKMASLATALTNQLDQAVSDETGLTGSYDITLYWTPDPTEPGGRAPSAAAETASAPDATLFAALEQQLGLKLAPRKVPRDVLVVDHAEKTPTEN